MGLLLLDGGLGLLRVLLGALSRLCLCALLSLRLLGLGGLLRSGLAGSAPFSALFSRRLGPAQALQVF